MTRSKHSEWERRVKCFLSRIKMDGRLYAQKVMDKKEQYNQFLFSNEKKILAMVKHRNILELVETFETKDTFNIITVLCQGGELFDRVKNGSFTEKVAARLAREMVQAIAYCHKNNVVHRDLKPENFVFETTKEDSHMKLIDFGCAVVVNDDELVPDVAGSPYYVAPEILRDYIKRTGKVWKASDMWSVGVIIFLFVCGYPPFNGDTQEKIFDGIKRTRFRFPPSSSIPLSDSVKDLIGKLLVKDPLARLTAEQVLQHPWIKGDSASDEVIGDVVVNNLGAFRTQCKLKKAVARALVSNLTDQDTVVLSEAFKRFDKNKDGKLSADEIADLMKSIGKGQEDVEKWMKEVDQNGDGVVNEEEFKQGYAVAVLGSSEEQLKNAFAMFDKDKNGFVTAQEIEQVCHFLTPQAVKQLIGDADKNNDGQISADKWILAMKDMDKKIDLKGKK